MAARRDRGLGYELLLNGTRFVDFVLALQPVDNAAVRRSDSAVLPASRSTKRVRIYGEIDEMA